MDLLLILSFSAITLQDVQMGLLATPFLAVISLGRVLTEAFRIRMDSVKEINAQTVQRLILNQVVIKNHRISAKTDQILILFTVAINLTDVRMVRLVTLFLVA